MYESQHVDCEAVLALHVNFVEPGVFHARDCVEAALPGTANVRRKLRARLGRHEHLSLLGKEEQLVAWCGVWAQLTPKDVVVHPTLKPERGPTTSCAVTTALPHPRADQMRIAQHQFKRHGHRDRQRARHSPA